MIEKGVEECEISYTTQKLEEKLISFFGDKIVICSGGNKKSNMINSSNMIMLWMCPVTMKDNLKTKLRM